MKLFIKLIIVLTAIITFQSNSVYEDTTIPSYDTSYVEGVDSFRQIYICNRSERTETYILIKNDTTVLWEEIKY